MVQEELEGMQIAQALVRIRERHGLTQKDIAERIGVSQPLIARLEAGKDVPQSAQAAFRKSPLDIQGP